MAMQLSELLDNLNKKVLLKVGIDKTVTSVDDLNELIDVLISNITLHQMVSDVRAHCLATVIEEYQQAIQRSINKNPAAAPMLQKKYSEMQRLAVKFTTLAAYDLVASELMKNGSISELNTKYGNRRITDLENLNE